MTGAERILELRHLRLAALEWSGAGRRHPVLALHGWLDNAASFQRLAPLLESLHLVAIDLPGHGRSSRWPAGHVHHFIDWVPVVIEAVDALGWRRFSLLGHSMGAGIATLLPAVAPDRVERLVLLEGLGPMTSAEDAAADDLVRALASEARMTDGEPRRFPDLAAAVAARCDRTDLDAAAARLLVERSTENTTNGVRFTHDPRLRSRSRIRLTEGQLGAFLRAIRCPVQVVRADHGYQYPEEVARRRLELVAGASVAMVEGGHHVHLTHPERVAPLVNGAFADSAGLAELDLEVD